MRFGESGQTLVDSSFLGLALLRAPKQLLNTMEPGTRARLIEALEKERRVQAPLNNWLLFAAQNEVLLRRLGAFWDRMRIDFALREHLLALMDELHEEGEWKDVTSSVVERARRYAVIQERSISSTGEFPLIGRFADIARRKLLPSDISPSGVRCSLTAVQQRTLNAAGTFSPEGWLQIGLAGHQPSLGERYISTGSRYLCSAAWLPLGLGAADPFWSGAAANWTQKSVWSGHDGSPDHALDPHSSTT